MASWKEVLDEDNHNSTVTANPGKEVPNAVICLDEARTLLDEKGSLLFRSLRDALRKQFARTNKEGTLNLTKPQGDFFAIILDTTYKVANFSPPVRHDPSQKRLRDLGAKPKLFPPLYAIDTINIFPKGSEKRLPDGSNEATLSLFRYGRPLWGARIESGESLYELMELARQKLDGQEPLLSTALLSYSLNFYIVNNTMAEELVSGWLRYILYVNEGRDLLRTTQPSEPILAHTSASMMLDPATRLSVVQQFVCACFEGSVNVGDIGEMVAAIVLLFTFDEALYMDAQYLPAAVSVKSFLDALLGSQIADVVINCADTNAEMRTICSKGEIFCNHFMKLEDPPCKKTLQIAFQHGVGIILPDNFPGADIVVPIRVSAKVSFLGIQVKNRKKDAYSSQLRRQP